MPLIEIIENYFLPIAGGVGGLTALVVFIFSRRQRIADARKTEVEVEEAVKLSPAKAAQMITEAAAKVLERQNLVNDALQKRLNTVTERMTNLEEKLDKKGTEIVGLRDDIDRLERELGIKEANMAKLEEKLVKYELENEQYRQENMILRKQIEAQRKRIKELENQLALIREELRGRGYE